VIEHSQELFVVDRDRDVASCPSHRLPMPVPNIASRISRRNDTYVDLSVASRATRATRTTTSQPTPTSRASRRSSSGATVSTLRFGAADLTLT
jgi:hypothetical protein